MLHDNYNYSMMSSARSFMYKVYAWMGVALAITAGIAYGMASSPAVMQFLATNQILFIGLMFAQVALVMFLGWKIQSLTYAETAMAFVGYAVLMGITSSMIFMIYTMSSIAICFAITSGMFALMAAYGYLTNADLSSLGSFLIMGLWGLILAMFVNIWAQSSAFQFMISLAGVGIFTLLTAYDTQKIKRMAESMMVDEDTRSKVAVMGALTLYLDFINLFFMLLRLFGDQRKK